MEKTNPKQFTSKSKYRTGAHMMISSLDPWDYVSTIFIKEDSHKEPPMSLVK